MKAMRQLERRLEKFAIPNLTLVIIAIQGLTFLALVGNPNLWEIMPMQASKVMEGEWWRLLSFMMMPGSMSPIWIIFELYILYLMGIALENHWGAVRYNLFWLIGYVLSIGVCFIAPDQIVTNDFLCTSVLLAFAVLYPDFELLLFFILPVKVKWFALFAWVVFGFLLISSAAVGAWGPALMIVAAVTNFFVFFGKDVVRRIARGHRSIKRKQEAVRMTREPFHKCVVCGKTDLTDPQMEFRYAKRGEKVEGFCLEHVPAEDTVE